ncbi:MAG: hypothetical protein J5699_00020 [Bacteroidales bacterium]|nr:hypothetical protein [Bacteroidales bacterium]
MRKLLPAVAALLVLASCDPADTPSKYTVPKYKEYHAQLSFNGEDVKDQVRNGVIPSTLELTSSGKYVAAVAKPEENKLVYTVGNFSIPTRALDVINLEGLNLSMTFKNIAASSWLVNLSNSKSSLSLDTEAKAANELVVGSFADSLCRSWHVKSISISATGSDIPSKLSTIKVFETPDISKIGDYFSENGVSVDVGALKDYVISDISFTEYSTLIINFTKAAPFIGTYSLDKNHKATYSFALQYEDNPVFAGTGKGMLTIDRASFTLTFRIESEIVTTDGKKYNGKVIFELV